MAVAQAIWEAASVFEVILRNRIVESWNIWFRVNGFSFPRGEWPFGITALHAQIPLILPTTPLNAAALSSLESQESKAFKRAFTELKGIRGRRINNGDIIARLTFGFWHECFSKHFRFINASQVKDIFPHYPYQHTNIEDDISEIAKDLQAIKDFRNRLAHHEKLDMSRVAKKYAQICEYISYVNPDALKLVSVEGFNHLLNSKIERVTRNFPYL
jgi:uncharacterized protein (DUF433 family)